MIGILNTLAMGLTIAFGCIGWLFPNYTLGVLDLQLREGSKMGLSEIRAANGALFVGVGLGALLIAQPMAFVMAGCVYAGAAAGRLTSIIVDGSGSAQTFTFLAVEAVLAIYLIYANL